ncbi:BTH_I0359 family protein [Sphaerotilus microaerophilus]|jgi:hypothetical protein|uniref:DUF3567 domain-containing protein n=1 Tax=Sphaerotilus microaerophilus TaxID=2914710 RepID=A0ABN6PUN9_9BURK|nr:DUF3567 domain-containing protein [Sphaerotilus sp. FB-5]BDI07804.1 hypothetical protein CATMQ487_47740 [Sphaerotilus sp. FB-5]
MHMLYNSDHFAVVQIEVPVPLDATAADAATEGVGTAEVLNRGGYEIVDKQTRRGVFLDGSMAEHFKAGVEDLIRRSPSAEEIDDYLSGYTQLAQQPVVLH